MGFCCKIGTGPIGVSVNNGHSVAELLRIHFQVCHTRTYLKTFENDSIPVPVASPLAERD